MKTNLTIGVRELVEFVLRSGDLKVEFAGASRAADAIRLHQKIQYSRPAGYAPEFAFSYQVETPGFSVFVPVTPEEFRLCANQIRARCAEIGSPIP